MDAEGLARGAVDWLVAHDGEDTADPGLYHGRAGILLALHEAAEHFGDERCADVVAKGSERLARELDCVESCSLYGGLASIAFTLDALGRPDDARRALALVRARVHDGRWGPMFELLAGNAGIGLAAHLVGDDDLAVDALTPYLSAATPTAAGANWPVRPSPARSHHVAHGTLGIACALARVGDSLGRSDFVELAIAGAEDVVARNEAGPDGFLVPHSDPPHRPDAVERYSYGWCNGPAGDAQVFRLLLRVSEDRTWAHLADQCWHTVTTSGLPQRLRRASGTTTAAAAAPPACSPSRSTASWRTATPPPSPTVSSPT